MKKICLLAAMLLGFTASVMADNLVVNGEFKRLYDGNKHAYSWGLEKIKDGTVKFFNTGAPDGGYAQFVLNSPCNFSMRQYLKGKIKPNAKYEISCKVRGNNFTAKAVGLIFINEGWSKSAGIRNIKPTAEWTEYKVVVTPPPFKAHIGLVFHAIQAKGTIEIADIEVEEVDND